MVIITNLLSPSSVNYGEKYMSYKTWKDKAAMKAGLSELICLSTNSLKRKINLRSTIKYSFERRTRGNR